MGVVFSVQCTYRKVASSNTYRLEAHAGFFRLLIKVIFDPYVPRPFDKKLISQIVTHVRTRNYNVCNFHYDISYRIVASSNARH